MNFGTRWIYFAMIAILCVPLLLDYRVPPAEMEAANTMYVQVAELEAQKGQIAFVALDFGPNTKAENEPQAAVTIEHLMRRNIPFAVFSQYQHAVGFLDSIPNSVAERLMQEDSSKRYKYGRDWVNLGYRPGRSLFLQGLAKSEDLASYLKKDAFGTALNDVPVFQSVKSLTDIILLAEFTGLTGMFDSYVQFFQRDGYMPTFIHGCTSITIPEAYIYLDSGQLKGLFEGIAGAAWYSALLSKEYSNRAEDDALLINTTLGVAHLAIIFLILLGNLGMFFVQRQHGVRG